MCQDNKLGRVKTDCNGDGMIHGKTDTIFDYLYYRQIL